MNKYAHFTDEELEAKGLISTLRGLCLNMSFGLSSGLLCIPLPLPLSEECKVVT